MTTAGDTAEATSVQSVPELFDAGTAVTVPPLRLVGVEARSMAGRAKNTAPRVRPIVTSIAQMRATQPGPFFCIVMTVGATAVGAGTASGEAGAVSAVWPARGGGVCASRASFLGGGGGHLARGVLRGRQFLRPRVLSRRTLRIGGGRGRDRIARRAGVGGRNLRLVLGFPGVSSLSVHQYESLPQRATESVL